jgi:RNA polymerase sigma factor (sigma-70 family)
MPPGVPSVPGQPATDLELMDRVRAGDRDAFGELYGRYRRLGYATALSLGVSAADADDVVAEAFLQIFDALLERGRSVETFGAYLATSVRHGVYRRHRLGKRLKLTDRVEDLDSAQQFADTSVTSFERATLARAFDSLPSRWREILFYTLVRGWKPSQAAPRMGLSANAAAALGLRAREGLRQAYLQAHLTTLEDEQCREFAQRLGVWTRAGMPARESQRLSKHLETCASCEAFAGELADINRNLRPAALAILLVSPAIPAFLRRRGGSATPSAQGAPKVTERALGRVGRWSRVNPGVPVIGGAPHIVVAGILVAAAAGAVMLVSASTSSTSGPSVSPPPTSVGRVADAAGRASAGTLSAGPGGSSTPPSAAVAALPASSIRLPSSSAVAVIVPADMSGRTLRPPTDPGQVGEWSGSASWTATTGQITLAGHTFLPGHAPFVFANLDSLRAGQLIHTSDARGHVTTWVVTRVEDRDKSRGVDPAAFRGNHGPRSLVLISCTGPVDSDGDYSSNVYVFADPA